jgi:hypothetical protein
MYYNRLTSRAVAAIDKAFQDANVTGFAIGPGERYVLRTSRATDWYTGTGMATFLQSLIDGSDSNHNHWINAFAYAGDSGWMAYSMNAASEYAKRFNGGKR